MKDILIIDDDMAIALTLKETLSKKYSVRIAGDGAAGLEEVKVKRPDLILLDLLMPKIGGYNFLKILQTTYKDEEPIPVIIFSNISSQETISEGVSYGIRGYIVKSNESLGTIQKTIENVLGESKK